GKDDSTHVVEEEGYGHGETLMVSSRELEESGTQDSGDARDGG
ncbi:hypothetical protein A2U01_0094145, partial [Trifolium medium]|nr:hypothetical protein [Trifolium medium]